jgi:hypothetical protein
MAVDSLRNPIFVMDEEKGGNMEPYSSSSSYELYSSPSRSVSLEDLSDEIAVGRRVMKDHILPNRQVGNGDRSRSFSHFSLKRKTIVKRTQSEGLLIDPPSRGKRIKEKLGSLFTNTLQIRDWVKTRISSSEPPEAKESDDCWDPEFEDFERPQLLVAGATRDSLEMDQEILVPFRLDALELAFPSIVHQLILGFVDESSVKNEACKKSAEIAHVKKRLKEEIKACRIKFKESVDDDVRAAQRATILLAKKDLTHMKSVNGVPFSKVQQEAAKSEHLKMVGNPQVLIDPSTHPGDIVLVYQCVFSLKGSADHYLFRKEGSIHHGEFDLYILEAQSTLRKSLGN